MRVKRILHICAVIMLSLFLISISACVEIKEEVQKEALFKVTALNISPIEVNSGETAIVNVDVENIGEVEGIYTTILTINGSEYISKEVALLPSSKETVKFEVSNYVPGTYQISVGELVNMLHVLKPAEFIIDDITISPVVPEVWEEATVAVTVKNIGEGAGRYEASLKIDGIASEKKGITIDSGTKETLTFSIVKDQGPECHIEINGVSRIFSIKEGVITNLNIGDEFTYRVEYKSPDEVKDSKFEKSFKVIWIEDRHDKAYYVFEGLSGRPLSDEKLNIRVEIEQTTMLIDKEIEWDDNFPYKLEHIYYNEVLDGVLYPLIMGNECLVKETRVSTLTILGDTSRTTETETYKYLVEKIEDISVPAGSFRCFKITKYGKDEWGDYNVAFESWWKSDKIKQCDIMYKRYFAHRRDILASYSISHTLEE